jgi:hypothetical protein
MAHPAFFDLAPAIRVRDPLAAFLGAAVDGVMEYRYVDAVKLAGHSCPTVAAAWLLTRRALQSLYGEALPERGGVRVELRDARDAGVTGVIANVAAVVTGAAGDTGFKGIAGHFDRRDLLRFAAEVPAELRFTRLDTGAGVDAAADLSAVPADPSMLPLLRRCVAGEASADEQARFGALWQDRVRRLLLEHADDEHVIAIRPADVQAARADRSAQAA